MKIKLLSNLYHVDPGRLLPVLPPFPTWNEVRKSKGDTLEVDVDSASMKAEPVEDPDVVHSSRYWSALSDTEQRFPRGVIESLS
jgi:hypothetical protein